MSKSIKKTPNDLLHWKKPSLSCLQICGCETYVKHLQPNKLDPKLDKCYFVGYPKETIGYSFYQKFKDKMFVIIKNTFSRRSFLAKEVSDRIVQLDTIIESLAEVRRIDKHKLF